MKFSVENTETLTKNTKNLLDFAKFLISSKNLKCSIAPVDLEKYGTKKWLDI